MDKAVAEALFTMLYLVGWLTSSYLCVKWSQREYGYIDDDRATLITILNLWWPFVMLVLCLYKGIVISWFLFCLIGYYGLYIPAKFISHGILRLVERGTKE